MSKNENIIWHDHPVNRNQREKLMGQKGTVLWFTGLSGSGKSTLAGALEQRLHAEGIATMLLDGDNIRTGLNSDLDFSENGRIENIRRLGEVCKLFVDSGIVVLTAFISPFQSDRDTVRSKIEGNRFLEVFIDTPLEICEQRDVKGLYKKARAGEIPNFTGIDSPYEAPKNPEIHIKTADISVEEGVNQLLKIILPKIKQ
jgi:adenylylsulfate kinase